MLERLGIAVLYKMKKNSEHKKALTDITSTKVPILKLN